MVREDKTRVVITLPVTMLERIDKLSDALGMSRSAFIGMSVGEKCLAYEKAFSAMDSMVEKMSRSNDEQLPGQMDIIDVVSHLNVAK